MIFFFGEQYSQSNEIKYDNKNTESEFQIQRVRKGTESNIKGKIFN